MPFCDMHTHTVYSPDGHLLPHRLCLEAVAGGLYGLAMTDHYDFFPGAGNIYYETFYKKRRQAFENIKGRFGRQLKVLYGVELGQPHYDMASYKKVMGREDFDVVIGSIHQMPNGNSIYHTDYGSQQGCDRLLEEYFIQMALMAERCDFDILAHIDYPVRVMEKWFCRQISLIYYRELIRPVLKTCAQKGMAIEVNTAGMRRWLKAPGPAQWVLEDFRSFGGRYVTLGSDAHRPEACGGGFEQAAKLIAQAGFDSTVYFEKRRPHFLPLGGTKPQRMGWNVAGQL